MMSMKCELIYLFPLKFTCFLATFREVIVEDVIFHPRGVVWTTWVTPSVSMQLVQAK